MKNGKRVMMEQMYGVQYVHKEGEGNMEEKTY